VDLRRYLVARKQDVQAAFDQLKATLLWRRDERVDSILDQPDPHEALFQQHVRHHLMGTLDCTLLFLIEFIRYDSFRFFVSSQRFDICFASSLNSFAPQC
jgi:hypothetical protein